MMATELKAQRPTNAWGRPFCRALGCDIEVHPLRKYCEVHDWRLDVWLEKSRAALDKYVASHKQEGV